MGTFRIEIQGVGGHGCQREKKNNELVSDCGEPSCPDCIARRCVAALKSAGVFFQTSGPIEGVGYALLTHWPHQAKSIVDDLLTGHRRGEF